MVLPASALASLADVKEELGIEPDDTSQDTRLEKLIKRASARIISFLGRSLHYSPAIVEWHAGLGGQFLTLARPPIWSVESIVWATSASDPLTLEATSYAIDDANAGVLRNPRGWPWSTVLNEGVVGDLAPGLERRDIMVTYAGGTTTPNQTPVTGIDALDADIEAACIDLVTFLDARRGQDPAIASESMLGYSVSYAGVANPNLADGGLPPSVAALLRPHQFLVQA